MFCRSGSAKHFHPYLSSYIHLSLVITFPVPRTTLQSNSACLHHPNGEIILKNHSEYSKNLPIVRGGAEFWAPPVSFLSGGAYRYEFNCNCIFKGGNRFSLSVLHGINLTFS
jgi:hypothetical protein